MAERLCPIGIETNGRVEVFIRGINPPHVDEQISPLPVTFWVLRGNADRAVEILQRLFRLVLPPTCPAAEDKCVTLLSVDLNDGVGIRDGLVRIPV
ncbi:MAG: hypothetical protein IIA67_06210 [Planctomycetes bacterium]|nr:hypothetical protein [Planctomycetota bacterium]